MTHFLLLLLLSLIFHGVSGRPLQNITLALPEGTSDHGTAGLLCTPTRWTDVIVFFLLNYVAHVATVITRPGERSIDFTATIIGCLLHPAMGLYRGIEAILSGAIWYWNDDLRKAARSGALCMAVRTNKWRPVDGSEIKNAVVKMGPKDVTSGGLEEDLQETDSSKRGVYVAIYEPPWIRSRFGSPVYVHRQVIHGTCSLPEGYTFAIVPGDCLFAKDLSVTHLGKVEIAANYNIVKALCALAQTAYASMTLYRSRGDQIEQFGFAAFGLTVAPFAVMSTINLIGSLCQPEYSTLYMVDSTIMDEARSRGGSFRGMIARLEEEDVQPRFCNTVDSIGDCHDVQDLKFCSDPSNHADVEATIASFEIWGMAKSIPQSPNLPGEKSSITSTASSESQYRYKTLEEPLTADLRPSNERPLLVLPSCNIIHRRYTKSENLEPIWDRQYPITNIWLQKQPVTEIVRCRVTMRFPLPPAWRFWLLKYTIALLISLTPLAINGIMTRFHTGTIPHSESSTWKSYTLQWLCFGATSGLWWTLDQERKDAEQVQVKWAGLGPKVRVLLYVVSASPAVGGFIVVGQMLARYGVCSWVGD